MTIDWKFHGNIVQKFVRGEGTMMPGIRMCVAKVHEPRFITDLDCWSDINLQFFPQTSTFERSILNSIR